MYPIMTDEICIVAFETYQFLTEFMVLFLKTKMLYAYLPNHEASSLVNAIGSV